MFGPGELAMLQQYCHEAAGLSVLEWSPFSIIIAFLNVVATEKYMKIQPKRTTYIKIQKENANQNHLLSVLWSGRDNWEYSFEKDSGSGRYELSC